MSVTDISAARDTFNKLAANPRPIASLLAAKDLCDIYLTQDSIVNNFHTVFGYRNETLALRFYNILSEGYNGVHIYMPTFYTKLLGLFEGHTM